MQWVLSSGRQVMVTALGETSRQQEDFVGRLLCAVHTRAGGAATPAYVFHQPLVVKPPQSVPFEKLRPHVRWLYRPQSASQANVFVAQNISTLLWWFWMPHILLPQNRSDMSGNYDRIILHGIKQRPIVHPLAKVLLVTFDEPLDKKCSYDFPSYNNFFEVLWDHRGLQNVVLVIKRGVCPDLFLTYDPLQPIGKTFGVMYKIYTTQTLFYSTLFDRRLDNLHGYKIRVSYSNAPPDVYNIFFFNKTLFGRNMHIFQTLQNVMNFELLFVTGTWTRNSTLYYCTQSILDLYFHIGDVSVNMCPWKLASSGFSPTPALCEMNHLGIIVPNPKAKDSWKVPFLAFSSEVWFLCVHTYIASAFCVCFVQRILGRTCSLSAGFLITLKLFVSAVSNGINKIQYLSHRVLFSGILLCSGIVLVCAFQASMYKLLTHPPRYPDIETLEDLDNSELALWYREPTIPNVFSYNSAGRLSEKMNFLNDKRPVHFLFKDLPKFEKGAYVDNILMLDFSGVYIPEIFSHFHILREHLFSQFLTMLHREESPFTDRFNAVIGRIVESGLISQWRNVGIDDFAKYLRFWNGLNINTHYVPEKSNTVFGMRHLFASYLVLFFGLSISTIVFFIENLVENGDFWKKLLPHYILH